MARRWIQAVDVEVDDQSKPVFESALEAIRDRLGQVSMADSIVYATTGVGVEQPQEASQPCKAVLCCAGVNLQTGQALNTCFVGVGLAGAGKQRLAIGPNNFEGELFLVDNVNKVYVTSPGGAGQTIVLIPIA